MSGMLRAGERMIAAPIWKVLREDIKEGSWVVEPSL
jgi:hypothetical protein